MINHLALTIMSFLAALKLMEVIRGVIMFDMDISGADNTRVTGSLRYINIFLRLLIPMQNIFSYISHNNTF